MFACVYEFLCTTRMQRDHREQNELRPLVVELQAIVSSDAGAVEEVGVLCKSSKSCQMWAHLAASQELF